MKNDLSRYFVDLLSININDIEVKYSSNKVIINHKKNRLFNIRCYSLFIDVILVYPSIKFLLKDIDEKCRIFNNLQVEEYINEILPYLKDSKNEKTDDSYFNHEHTILKQFSIKDLLEVKINDNNDYEMFINANKIITDREKKILLYRINNRTLDEIGKEFNITRERVRQIEKKINRKLPNFVEYDKYIDIFEEFDINYDTFYTLYQEDYLVYKFLMYKRKKPKLKDIFYLVMGNDNWDYDTKVKALKLSGYSLLNNGDLVRDIKFGDVFEIVLRQHSDKPIRNTTLASEINQFIKDNNLNIAFTNERSIEGIGSRCNKCIISNNMGFRYFNNFLEKNIVDKIASLFVNLEDGIYSTRNIFNNNLDFMCHIGLYDYSELYDLCRRLQISTITKFNRNPEFTIGKIEKYDFVYNLIKQNNGIDIDEFTELVYDKYGLAKNSFRTYLSSNFSNHISKDKKMTIEKFYEISDELGSFLANLNNDIYLAQDLVSLVREFPLNNNILKSYNYLYKNGYVYRDVYSNASSAIKATILKKDKYVLSNTNLERTALFASVLYLLEKDCIIVKIDNDSYVKIDSIENLSVKIIQSFINELSDFAINEEFFTYYSIKCSGFKHDLLKLNYSDVFYDRLLLCHGDFTCINNIHPYLFARKFVSSYSIEDFVYNVITTRKNKDIGNILSYILAKYGIIMDRYRLISMAREKKLSFNETSNSFAID